MKRRFQLAAVLVLSAAFAVPALAQGPGAALYKAKCAMCHGADGLAATPMGKMMKITSFKAPAMKNAPEAQLIAATRDGKGKMPAYKGKLTDQQINEVVHYIRSLQR